MQFLISKTFELDIIQWMSVIICCYVKACNTIEPVLFLSLSRTAHVHVCQLIDYIIMLLAGRSYACDATSSILVLYYSGNQYLYELEKLPAMHSSNNALFCTLLDYKMNSLKL